MQSGVIRHVLVATDFSPGAVNAATRAARLPLAHRATLTLLHVAPAHLPAHHRAEIERDLMRSLEAQAEAVRAAAAAAGATGLAVKARFSSGTPHQEIPRLAREAGAELIVVGRHGERPLRDLFIGSTAERVIRCGDLPVLVVARRARGPYRRPVVAVDLDGAARATLAAALPLVGPAPDGVVCHAASVPFAGYVAGSMSEDEMARYRADIERDAGERLSRLVDGCDAAGWRRVIRRGDPRLAVLREVARHRADLLVLGTHARTAIARVLLGSVAEWLIRSATCDVLVVRSGAKA